jgi:hypothetical protein
MALSPTGSRASGGSSYTPPTARQGFGTSTGVSIANGGNARLAWDGQSYGPNVLLDRTDPTIPVITTAGIYAVLAVVVPGENMTAGGSFQVSLGLDTDDTDASAFIESPAATAGALTPNVSIGLTWYMPAEATIRLNVRNHDGVAERLFEVASAQVQRIT